MKSYAMAEAELGIPESFRDDSTTTLVYDHPEGAVRLVVLRGEAKSGVLAEATSQQLYDLRRTLPRFELVSSTHRTVAGIDAVEMAIRFAHSDGEVYQRMASILIGGRLVVLAVQGPPRQEKAIDTLFEHAASGATLPGPKEKP